MALEQRQRPSVFIKDMRQKGPEDKIYYLLIVYPEEDRMPYWTKVQGQSDAAIIAKNYILEGCDLDESKVLVSTHENMIDGMVSIYWFMYKMQSIYPDLEMDIESFASGDPIEVTQASENLRMDVSPQVSITPEGETYDTNDV